MLLTQNGEADSGKGVTAAAVPGRKVGNIFERARMAADGQTSEVLFSTPLLCPSACHLPAAELILLTSIHCCHIKRVSPGAGGT